MDKINGFQILYKVYNEIITTPEIADEFGKLLPSWIKVEKVKDTKYQKFIETLLDKGESSAIALAAEKPGATLILDDLKARKIAKRLGFKVTGTLGVINKAKEIGVIKMIKPYIEKLNKTDFRISDRIIDSLLKKNNE
ncbi:MAG: DUF3368 domain-containing protein [Mangrovibacterium sp.]